MKLVIFDCDGTLVDSQHMIVAAMNSAFSAEGLVHPPREKVLSIVGLSLSNAITHLVPVRDEEMIARLADSYKGAFADLRRSPEHREPMFPGAREALETLAARPDTRLGIATGKSRRGVDRLLAREGWNKHFTTIQTADDHPSKPHPSMLTRAMQETGALPHQTIMIGDTTYDIEMARAANVGALGVTWGYHLPQELEDAGAHLLIHDYESMPPALTHIYAKLNGTP